MPLPCYQYNSHLSSILRRRLMLTRFGTGGIFDTSASSSPAWRPPWSGRILCHFFSLLFKQFPIRVPAPLLQNLVGHMGQRCQVGHRATACLIRDDGIIWSSAPGARRELARTWDVVGMEDRTAGKSIGKITAVGCRPQ